MSADSENKKTLTPEEREYFKKIILEKRDKLIKQLEYKRETYLNNTPGGQSSVDSNYAYHMADVGTDAQEREKNFMHFTRENKYLASLNEALERVERDPNYGFCIECGARIPNERLIEVPHTRHCVVCKSRIK